MTNVKRMGDTKVTCRICNSLKPISETSRGDLLRSSLNDMIAKKVEGWKSDDHICFECLAKFRGEHVRQLLESEEGELTNIQNEVIESLKTADLLARDTEAEYDRMESIGEKIADKVALFGGSWTFIFIFMTILLVWIGFNLVAPSKEQIDPFPFIFLNLILSCIAALQAPVIMMSQNRQSEKDRMRAENDYRVNLKAELEIRHLGLKLDQLMTHQWRRLLDIQQIQLEIMHESAKRN